MKHVVLILSSVCLACGGTSCGVGAAALPHTVFDGAYSLTPVDGPKLRFRISQGTVVSFEEDGVDKPVTTTSAIQQIPGEIRFFSFSAVTQMFDGRSEQQWTVSFTGDQKSTDVYEGTMTLRLTAQMQAFENYQAVLRRVGD